MGDVINVQDSRHFTNRHNRQKAMEYGVPSQKLGHLGQSLLAGICEICGLPVVID